MEKLLKKLLSIDLFIHIFIQKSRFHVFGRSKSLPLIDCPMMLCYQPRWLLWDYTDVKNWLLSYSVDQSPSIFLGVILLYKNKPRPWKCLWTSSKKRKKQTRNENAAMSDHAKVGGKLKLQLWDQACKRSSQELRKAL